jgi:hypothetical protein
MYIVSYDDIQTGDEITVLVSCGPQQSRVTGTVVANNGMWITLKTAEGKKARCDRMTFMWGRRYPLNAQGIPYDPISGKTILRA